MARAKKDLIDITKTELGLAVRIVDYWRSLDRALLEDLEETRGANFPSAASEIFACYAFDLKWNKGSAGDAYDSDGRIIEVKSASAAGYDVTSFSPKEVYDNLVFVRYHKYEDVVYIYDLHMNSADIGKMKVNSTETLEDQQKAGRRPRFSIERDIIENKGLSHTYKLNLLTKELFDSSGALIPK